MIDKDNLAFNSSLNLNIVAIPQAEPIKGGVKKKRKNNKYEKRRRKAEQAKAAKFAEAAADLNQQTQQEANKKAQLQETEEDELSEEEPDVGADHTKEEEEESLLVSKIDDDEEFHEDNVDASEDNEEEIAESSTEDEEDQDARKDKDSSAASAAHPVVDALQDEAYRAKYLAEFHARPLELDRRAGAATAGTASSSKRLIVPSSHESGHLFAEASEWKHLPLHERLIASVTNSTTGHFNFSKPTVVQSRAIAAFAREDQAYNLLLQAETGSGKTLAYLLPILQALAVGSGSGSGKNDGQELKKVNRSHGGTRCILLCPTRELAAQTFGVVEQLCASSFNWIVPGCLFGEERRKSEKARLRRGLSVVVATPGRLLDHLMRTESLLMAIKGKLEWLVLDEADRLLDMGLGDQVKQIVQRIRANQPGSGRNGITWRSVLVSATVTPHVEALAKETLIGRDNTWVWVQGGSGGRGNHGNNQHKQQHEQAEESSEFAQSTPQQLTQLHMTVSAKLRLPALISFLVLRAKKQERTVVFLSTCAAVDYYHALLTAMGSVLDGDEAEARGVLGKQCSIYKLHGSIPHGERQQTLRHFVKVSSAKKTAAVLFATDVASRGLNLPDVDWIVQYDPPGEVTEYVHRAGRVARAGRAGHSLLFLLPSERPFLDILKKRGVKKMSALSLASTLNAAADVCKGVAAEGVRRSGGGFLSPPKGAACRTGEAFASEVQRRLEECVSVDDAKIRASLKGTSKKQRRQTATEGSCTGGLMEMARNAFVSHIRAYPTKEKLVRHVFSAKALHLGHVARSFALKEAPKKLATMASKLTAVVIEKADSRKRNSSMAFEAMELLGDEQQEQLPKRQNSISQRNRNSNTKGSHLQSSKARFLANASKLQTTGLDGL